MYWNGERWTGSRRPGASSPKSPPRVTAWYLVACVAPFVAAILVPVPVMVAVSPEGGVGPMDAWMGAGFAAIGAGWALWLCGWLGWRSGASVFREELARAPDALDSWDRAGRGWAVGVGLWGIAATVALGGLLMLGMGLGGVSNGL
jgi:hypothetical protein